MASPEVLRVRLTAEGIQEVLGALRKVQTGVKATKKDTEGLGSRLKNELRDLGLAAAAVQMARFVKANIDAQASVQDLVEITGAGAETISTLGMAARREGVAMEALGKGLGRFARFMEDVQRGGTQSTKTLQAMGLSIQDLAGKDLEQQFLTMANALAKFSDEGQSGLNKTALAMQVFGRGGADMVQVMGLIAEGGFQKLQEEGRKTGEVLDDSAAQAAKRAKVELAKLEGQVQGLTNAFSQGLIPELANLGDAITGAADGGTSAFKTFGSWVGKIVSGVAGAFKLVGVGLAAFWNTLASYFEETAAKAGLMWDVVSGKTRLKDLPAAAASLEKFWKDTRKSYRDDAQKDILDFWERLFPGAEAAAAAAASGGGNQGTKPDKKDLVIQADGTEKRAGQAIAAQAKRALDAEKEELEAFLELTESFYERGLIDLDTYLAARRTAIERSTAAEVRALEEQIRAERAGAAAGTPAEKGAAAIKIGDLQAQITAKRTEGEQKLQVLERLGTEKREQAALEALKLEAELEAAKGRTGEAAIRAIQAEYEERIRVARSQEAKAALQGLQAQAVAKSDLSGKTQAADLGKARMDTALQAIDNNLAVGALSDAAAQEKRIQVYQRFLPLLRELAEAQLAAAQTTNDPALIQQAEAQLVNLQGQEAQLVRMKDTLADFKEAAADAFVDGFANFLATLADNTSSLTDKVKALGASIAQAVAQLAAMQIAKAAAGAMGFASGGLVLGPGTGTSDSIPAWLSNGEFVMRNAARSYYGADFMAALNGLRVPKEAIRGFADGGLVTPEPTPVPVRGEFSHRVELGLSDGLVLRALDTPEGARVITRMVGSNTKRFNRALGRG